MSAQWGIEGKTVLVTGGASGMGALHVESYLREGAKFVAILDVVEDKGKALETELSKTYNGKVGFIRCDVGDEASIAAAFSDVLSRVKQLDIIVNNAAIMNDLEKTCDVNWRGLVSFCMKGVNHMRKDQGGAGGTIINIASVAALFMSPILPVYNGSKAAVLHFSRCLAMDPFFSNTGVRLLTICFGATNTPMWRGLTKAEQVIDKIHYKNFVTKSDGQPYQSPESAVRATTEMYKKAANGSVWISQNDAPAQEITATIAKAYDLMASVIA